MVRAEPPQKIHDVRAGKFRDAVPGDRRKIQVFDVLAVDVDVKLARDLRDPLDRNPFRAVALVQERRNNREASLFLRNVHAKPEHIISQLACVGINRCTRLAFCTSGEQW